MATMTETPDTTVGVITPAHTYHAKALGISGKIQRPIKEDIEDQARVSLDDRRGGHFERFVEEMSLEGFVTFKRAESRVSGHRNPKNNGWVTLATSIVEGLNVFEIITVDRVVSQLSTDHPYVNGHVPEVTFVGTQFVDMKIGGFPVTPKMNLGIFPKKPHGDESYFDNGEFLTGIQKQTKSVIDSSDVPSEIKQQYDEKYKYVTGLIEGLGKPCDHLRKITFSVVDGIVGEVPIPGFRPFGHILQVPGFGAVSLGEVTVTEKIHDPKERPDMYIEMTLIHMNLGCVGHGTVQAATVATNGHHVP